MYLRLSTDTFHVLQRFFSLEMKIRCLCMCHQTNQGLQEDKPGPGPSSYYPLLFLPSHSFFLVAFSPLAPLRRLPPKPQQNGGERARPLALPHACRLAAPPLRRRHLRRAKELRCVIHSAFFPWDCRLLGHPRRACVAGANGGAVSLFVFGREE
jgi:hypothetical protein